MKLKPLHWLICWFDLVAILLIFAAPILIPWIMEAGR